MSYTNGTIIKTLTSGDETRKIDFVARYDGLFQWYEYKWVDGEDFVDAYWGLGPMSGLYATEELAERDAADGLPWLRGLI